jgi:hypothetical protein
MILLYMALAAGLSKCWATAASAERSFRLLQFERNLLQVYHTRN